MSKIARYVTLDVELWSDARKRGLNVSECCERGLAMAMTKKEYGDKRVLEVMARMPAPQIEWARSTYARKAGLGLEVIRRVVRRETGITLTSAEIQDCFGVMPAAPQ
jgi:hypothetical protein